MSATTHLDAAVAATMPMALRHLADHITDHQLPSPAYVEVPGALVGEATIPEVTVVLDQPRMAAWVASLDTADEAVISSHAGGAWYDVHGVANCIRVRLSWFVPASPADVEVDHETCRGGCGQTLCYCRGREHRPCSGAIEPGCHHGEYLCHECMTGGCTDCADDVAGMRAESWADQ